MPRFRPVFTPIGWIVLFIAAILLVRALVNRNSYEIVLASAALLLLLVLGIIGTWKSKKLKSLEPGWKPPSPMTAQIGFDNDGEGAQNQTLVTGLDAPVPLFFRLHYFIRGRFHPSGSTAETKNGCRVTVETSVPRGEAAAQLPLDFPMSGVFIGDGFCRLRDIFGFFSFPYGQPQRKTVKIRCAPCFGKKTYINAQTGAEDRRNKPAADIERYYMREYTPGDRFRDINWKSSEKIDTLVTRISTDNQEKISRIEVHFRNYCPSERNDKKGKKLKREASLEELWLLDRAKARLSYFLRSLMEQNSSFIFNVRTAGGSWEIEDQDDLEDFFEELATLSFMPPQQETGISPGTGDVYVFSTACDIGLPVFLLACHARPVTLFLIQPTISSEEAETEILHLRDFYTKGCALSPRWLVREKVRPLGVQANKVEMFYAGIKP